MKSILRTFVIALATMVASSAYAQMPQGGQRPERPQFSPENMAKMQTEQMAQTLKLSDAQLQAVYELNLANAIEQVKQICSRAIWLKSGRVVMDGEVNQVCDEYMKR